MLIHSILSFQSYAMLSVWYAPFFFSALLGPVYIVQHPCSLRQAAITQVSKGEVNKSLPHNMIVLLEVVPY